MNLDDAIREGKVVVVAGAGISKDAPANLPSWWEYNIILLEMIGKIGAEALDKNGNLLNMASIKKNIPVTSVSEFFVNRIAGESYYPLISMLDGAQPNINHFMLAELAKSGIISSIVTTNFDTLIEKAFNQLEIPINVYNTPMDYYDAEVDSRFPIYKIHGSADKSEFAIDTVHQKLQGLSIEKREIMKKLFAENHIVFMGFSGEDYLFGTDYIPIQANQLNDYGITWLAHPGSTFNDHTKELMNELKINTIHTTLHDFYKQQGWKIHEVVEKFDDDKNGFRSVAEMKIRDLLERPHIGKLACLGMCIQLLDLIGELNDAETLVQETKRSLNNMIDLMEGLKRISLYSSMAHHSMLMNHYVDAFNFTNSQLKIFEMEYQFSKQSGYKLNKRESALNRSTVVNRMGLIDFELNQNLLKARDIFIQAFILAYEAMHWENISDSLYNIAVMEFNMWSNECNEENIIIPKFIAKLEAARRIAAHGGCAQVLFQINCKLIEIYSLFGQKELLDEVFEEARKTNELCITREANNTILDNLEYFKEQCIAQKPWPKKYMFFNEPYDDINIWHPYGQRPVLKIDAGKKAKELYDDEKYSDCLKHLLNSAEWYLDKEEYENAEMLLDCAYGIFIDAANNAYKNDSVDVQINNLNNARMCLMSCINAEMHMGRIDYFAESLGSLSRLNCFDDFCDDLDFAAFQAELSLCICDDPCECWQAIHAAEAACRINLKNKRSISAEKYCRMYLDMVTINPNAADLSNIELMKMLLIELEEKNEKYK